MQYMFGVGTVDRCSWVMQVKRRQMVTGQGKARGGRQSRRDQRTGSGKEIQGDGRRQMVEARQAEMDGTGG